MFPDSQAEAVVTAKKLLFSDTSDAAKTFLATSQPLYESWVRSHQAVGLPNEIHTVPKVDENLLDDSLLEALHGPLSEFARSLNGTGVGLLLADAQGHILDRWADQKTGNEHLDSVGSVRGARLAEDTVGTNGVGTPLVTGKVTQITANEHYADLYSSAICTGAPLFHPITKKTIGAVTLSCDLMSHRALLQALIVSLTSNLDQHLRQLEAPGTKQMLDFFLHHSQKSTSPVIGFDSSGVLIQNNAAHRFSNIDLQLIHHAAKTANNQHRVTVETTLGSMLLEVKRFQGSDNWLVKVSPSKQMMVSIARNVEAPPVLVGSSAEWRDLIRNIAQKRTSDKPLLLHGEKGTGKTSLAIGTPYNPSDNPPGVHVIDCGMIPITGSQQWFTRLETFLKGRERIVIRNVDILEPLNLEALRYLITNTSASSRIAFTASVTDLHEVRSLAFSLHADILEALPLRKHPNDINVLWKHFATKKQSNKRLVLSPTALATLQRYDWPGNLKELQTVVGQILDEKPNFGEISTQDLPESIRNQSTQGLIEIAEEEALRRALHQSGGNRTKAAEILGVSRATVYRKMKSYGVDS